MSSFFEKLEKVRARPEHERRQITFWASAGITALVAAVWVASLSFTLSAPSTSQVASVGAIKATTTSATDNQNDNWLNNNKTKVIAGWKVITNQK